LPLLISDLKIKKAEMATWLLPNSLRSYLKEYFIDFMVCASMSLLNPAKFQNSAGPFCRICHLVTGNGLEFIQNAKTSAELAICD
jgi:hypothetical protein